MTRRSAQPKDQLSSLTQAVDIRQDNSYLIVGERTNTNGSRQFKHLLQEDNWDGLVSLGRDEIKGGAMVLDVCVDFVGRDGKRDMHEVVRRYVQQIPVPLMIDSTDPEVMEVALKLAGGRCALNSANLEDGEGKFARLCGLAKRYGAALVVGCIDEDPTAAMARTAERKIAIATRARDLAVGKHGLRDSDLMFDPLVLPISTGIEEDRRNALETIEGTRRIARELPLCHTVVGLSNVSFGLKPAARVVLNSVFLHELREAGLTGAIVHASKILPRNRIDDVKWNAALDLIYDRRREEFDPLTHFVGLFSDEGEPASTGGSDDEQLPIDERLKRHIIDGEKRNLTAHLDEAMAGGHKPLDIINNFLLGGMKVVGDLFGSGQMQLPFVLQSAETMKAAVAHLEPHMDKLGGDASKGKIVLATVRGDVHDIGKNLVDIILTNNGYTVHNLGIKQPIGDILAAADRYGAQAVGMSGLLVKSVAVMKDNLVEMNGRGVRLPVLLGGAALTREYAEEDLAELYGGPLLYCRDAFDGLKMMDHIGTSRTEVIVREQQERVVRRRQLREKAVKPSSRDSLDRPQIATDNPTPRPPFWGSRVADVPVSRIFGYVNEVALFTGQWGFKKRGIGEEEFERSLEEKARPKLRELQERAMREIMLEPKVTWGYFPVQSEGDDLIIYRPAPFAACTRDAGEGPITPSQGPLEWLRFALPRQEGRRRLCIADYFRSRASGQFDVLGAQLVTMGRTISRLAEAERKADRYTEYLYLHGFGVECAEALAEFWHKRMRTELGFASEDAAEVRKLFQQGYRGSRYSFGYPACPSLEDRAKLLELLDPAAIGVELTEEFMLDPEQSTDALVVHHPQAKYFDV